MTDSATPQTSLQELLEIQLSMAKEIAEVPDPLAILDHMLGKLNAIQSVDAVGVYFQRGEDSPFLLRGNYGISSDAETHVEVVENGQWHELEAKLKARNFQNVVFLPIHSNGEIRGKLVVASVSPVGFSDPVLVVLQTVAVNLGGMVLQSNTEADLRNSRHNLSTVFEKLGDFLFVVDQTGHIVTCNSGQLEKLGYKQARVVKQPINRLLPGVWALLEEQNDRLFNDCCMDRIHPFKGKLLDSNNRILPVEIMVSAGQWDDSSVWYVSCRDMKDQLVMERERDHLAKAIEQTTESVVITNVEGSILYTNPAFCKLTGYTKEEAIGANPSILKSGNHDESFYRKLWDTISRGDTWTGRFENTKKDGSPFVEEASISPMLDDDGKIIRFIGVKRDVTAEVGLEIRLRESQKMEAIGTLAGGIAHDFNNILYALLGYGQLALDDIPVDHPAHIPVQEICKAGERATDLVDKMLTFGRRADSGREVVALKPVIEEALGLARASLPATIDFNIVLEEGCSLVEANQTQIHQVVLNLCTNAEYALRETSGILNVSLQECNSADDIGAEFKNLPSGNWLRLQISDTGTGMDQAVVDRIFEPYFTTKKAHEGTGLGLATAHGIIKSHKGHIFVTSAVGEGTTFTIFFPVSSKEAPAENSPARTEDPNPEEIKASQGNIMIIDDEQMIVDILCKALPRQGYDVAGFTEGIKALEVFRASPGAFDLVITDQTMPQITGFELAAELLSIRPDLPIMLTTGYADLASENTARAIGISKFVSKPLKISELDELVSELLGETAHV